MSCLSLTPDPYPSYLIKSNLTPVVSSWGGMAVFLPELSSSPQKSNLKSGAEPLGSPMGKHSLSAGI